MFIYKEKKKKKKKKNNLKLVPVEHSMCSKVAIMRKQENS